VPHVFLLLGQARMAPLLQPADAVRTALRGKAVWTLDTAARLMTGQGFLASPDLTGYMTAATFEQAVASGLLGEPTAAGLTVAPLYRRPPMLLVHLTEDLPEAVELPSGDQVAPWDFLIRDVFGTLGWRPDLLTRLEALRAAQAVAQAAPSGPSEPRASAGGGPCTDPG